MSPIEANQSARSRGVWVAVCFTILFAVVVGLLVANSRVYPSLRPRVSAEIERATSATDRSDLTAERASAPAETDRVEVAEAPPRLVAESTLFDFGQMNPFTIGRHTFAIRNEGPGPLRLLDHRSTCKCTASQFPRTPIAPGAEAEVIVEWRTELNNRQFEQSAIVETNDPQRPSISFTIKGEVLVEVGADPPELVLPGIRPDTAATVSTLISSQVWSGFTLANIRTTFEGATWTVEPTSPEECERVKVRTAQRLTVHLPSTLAEGPFTGQLGFDVVPDNPGAETKKYELPIHGKVLRRLAVYGPGIDHLGNLRLGIVPAGKKLRRRLTLKVYDHLPELSLAAVEVEPSFLQAAVTPCRVNEQAKGLYFLDIVVPPTAPACRHQEREAGTLTLRFDHPRIAELKLRVHLAVAKQLADHH